MSLKTRPVSYSEGHISTLIPSPQTNIVPLLVPSQPHSSPHEQSPYDLYYNLVMRFSLHLALISLFETVFFWLFVSKQENDALEVLVDSYTKNILSNCSSLPIDERMLLIDLVNSIVNVTHLTTIANDHFVQRTNYNNDLFRNSWLYVGCITTIVGGLATDAYVRGKKIPWCQICGENAAMIVFLGAYEWMFFSTVVLKYQAISAPELDQRVVEELYQQCR